jgi:hypothetical protein
VFGGRERLNSVEVVGKVHHSHCYLSPEDEDFDLKTLSGIYYLPWGCNNRPRQVGGVCD